MPQTHTQEMAQKIIDAVNQLGNQKEEAKIIANDHPTIQQSFMRLAINFIHEESLKTYADGRNEATVRLSKQIMKQFPYEDIHLPLI